VDLNLILEIRDSTERRGKSMIGNCLEGRNFITTEEKVANQGWKPQICSTLPIYSDVDAK